MGASEKTWNEIVTDWIVRHNTLTKKTTRPLFDHFGISYFTYHRIDKDGNYSVLIDRPEWAERYVSDKIYLDDPYLRHPEVYTSGLLLFGDYGSEKYKEKVFRGGAEVLDVNAAVMLVDKQADGVEFFGFCGNSRKSALHKLYLNDSNIFYSFARHFKEKLSAPLATVGEAAKPLLQIKGDDFLCPEPIRPKITGESRLAFLEAIGARRDIEGLSRLSKRELDCLRAILAHETSKGIAAALGLSSRTVEHYIDSIKCKLNCWSKQDVSAIARRWRDLGLL